MEWNEVRALEAVKLNIGGGIYRDGKRRFEGWISVDGRSGGGHYSVRHKFPAPMDLEQSSVDAIMSEHFLEHVELSDAFHVLCECRRVLKQGGKLRMAVPDIYHPLNEQDRKNGFDKSRHHRSIFSVESLTGMLAAAGFETIMPMSYWLYEPEYKHTHRKMSWSDGWIKRTVGNDRRNRQGRPWGELWATSLIVDAIK